MLINLLCCAICVIILIFILIGAFRPLDCFRGYNWIATKLIGIIGIFSLAHLSMQFKPNSGADLALHLLAVDAYRRAGNPLRLLQRKMTENICPGVEVYSFLAALNNNEHFLQGMTIVITYSCIGLVLYCIGKKNKITSIPICTYLLVLFTTLGFANVFGSMRLPLSFAISYLCIYFLCYHEWHWLIVVAEIFAVSIHLAGCVPIVIFLLSTRFLKTRYGKKLLLVSIVVISALGPLLASSQNVYIGGIGQKLFDYKVGEMYHIAYRVYFAEIIIIALVLFLFYSYLKNYSDKTSSRIGSKAYYDYFEGLLLYTAGCVINNQIFNRFFILCIICSFPFICDLLHNKNTGKLVLVPLCIPCAVILQYNVNTLMNAYTWIGG